MWSLQMHPALHSYQANKLIQRRYLQTHLYAYGLRMHKQYWIIKMIHSSSGFDDMPTRNKAGYLPSLNNLQLSSPTLPGHLHSPPPHTGFVQRRRCVRTRTTEASSVPVWKGLCVMRQYDSFSIARLIVPHTHKLAFTPPVCVSSSVSCRRSTCVGKSFVSCANSVCVCARIL